MPTNHKDLSDSSSSDVAITDRLHIQAPLSPAQSVSDDSYSDISGSGILDTQSEQASANASSQPALPADLSEEIDRMIETMGILQLELFNAKAEHNEALQRFEAYEAAKRPEDDDIQRQLDALSEDIIDKIADVHILITKHQEAQADIALAGPLFKGQTKVLRHNHKASLEKSHKINFLRADKDKLEAVHAARDNTISSHKSENENLKETTKLLEQDENDLTTKLASFEGESRALQEVNAFLQEKGAMLRRNIEDRDGKITKLNNQVQNLKGEVKNLKQDKLDLHVTIGVRNREINALEKELVNANLHKSDLQRDVDARGEHNLELQNEVATLEADKGDLEDRIRTLNEDIERLRDWVEYLHTALVDQGEDVDDYKEKLQNARLRGRRLKKQRDNARAAEKNDGR